MSMKWEPKRKRAADGGGTPRFLRVKDDGGGNDYVYILDPKTGNAQDVWFLRTDRDKERFRREADLASLDKDDPGKGYVLADPDALKKVTNWRVATKDLEEDPSLVSTLRVTAHSGAKDSRVVSSSKFVGATSDYPVLYRDVPAPGKQNVKQREIREVPSHTVTSGDPMAGPHVYIELSPQQWRASIGRVMAAEGRGLYGRYAEAAALTRAKNPEATDTFSVARRAQDSTAESAKTSERRGAAAVQLIGADQRLTAEEQDKLFLDGLEGFEKDLAAIGGRPEGYLDMTEEQRGLWDREHEARQSDSLAALDAYVANFQRSPAGRATVARARQRQVDDITKMYSELYGADVGASFSNRLQTVSFHELGEAVRGLRGDVEAKRAAQKEKQRAREDAGRRHAEERDSLASGGR